MVDESGLKRRERALEDEFFARQNRKLLEELRTKQELAERKEALARASGLRNDELLTQLVEQGIGPDTLAALSLVPLVMVAWADGSVEAREREAVLESAIESGVHKEDVAYELLQGWLERRPEKTLLASWKAYIGELSVALGPVGKVALRDAVLGRARRVAEAAGGFLGIGKKISSEEEAVLADLQSAFE